jgi:hypothetical protein
MSETRFWTREPGFSPTHRDRRTGELYELLGEELRAEYGLVLAKAASGLVFPLVIERFDAMDHLSSHQRLTFRRENDVSE